VGVCVVRWSEVQDILGHIYQHFVITKHYYIVFYQFITLANTTVNCLEMVY
jgi:hypothetical protein